MKIAIPSYNRATILKTKSLPYLLSQGFDPSEIFVFLKNEEQLALYTQEIDTPLTWVVCHNQNLTDKRTYIRKYFSENEEVVCCDDDIRRIKMMNPRPLRGILEALFALTRKEGLTTWGIYPVNNLFFCKERVVRGALYIIGCFYGYINTPQQDWPNFFSKEDWWYSCLRITTDGAVLRYEGICPDTTYYAKGGLSEIRSDQTEEAHAIAVQALYPTLVKHVVKKNGHHDLKFLRSPKTLVENNLHTQVDAIPSTPCR